MTHPQLRPPAVPLVVCDPYLSVWSTSDALTDEWPKHWTGQTQAMCGLIRIDNNVYRFIGAQPRQLEQSLEPMRQTSLRVLPTRTLYTFEAANIKLELTFTTPLLPQTLDLMSRPVTYIDMSVTALDQKPHKVTLYLDISSSWVVNTVDQEVVWGRYKLDANDLLFMGSKEQAVLAKSGDDLRIDWGYLYTTSADTTAQTALGLDVALRTQFVTTGMLPTQDDMNMPRAVDNRPPNPVAAWRFELGDLTQTVHKSLLVAYDDRFSVEYMYRKLRPYWRKTGWDVSDLLKASLSEAEDIKTRCAAFDEDIMMDLSKAGGNAYAELAALSFRQCIAAHKLVADLDGSPLFFSKENFSNGCMGTVDVTYPSSPFFLLFNPTLLEAQITPILDYAASGRWKFPFAPHDLGRYPLANGQVYGGGEATEIDQMPVEECGNMLLLVAALCKTRSDYRYAQRYWPLLKQWAIYLLDKGLDPENQLCTDDFAGHLAHNVNLSLKALVALAAFASLCDACDLQAEAKTIRGQVEAMVSSWQSMAEDGDHYRLAFDKAGSWSQKYNLVWDKLLDLNLFPAEVAQKEIAFYKTQQDQYGLPLDNRSSYTKFDWIVWSASLADTREDFELFITPLYKWLNETASRVPLTDWYFTDSGLQRGFQARSVVGGVYIKLLYDQAIWQKWLQRIK